MSESVLVPGIIASVAVLAVSILIGFWARKLTSNLADYYVAGRSIGAVNNGFAMLSLSLSLTTFLGLTAMIIFGFYLAVAIYAAFTAAFIAMLVLAAQVVHNYGFYRRPLLQPQPAPAFGGDYAGGQCAVHGGKHQGCRHYL